MSDKLAAQHDAGGTMRERESTSLEIAQAIRRLLFQLAKDQETAAANEAADVPYWKPCPISVIGLRAAARVLRDAAASVPEALVS